MSDVQHAIIGAEQLNLSNLIVSASSSSAQINIGIMRNYKPFSALIWYDLQLVGFNHVCS